MPYPLDTRLAAARLRGLLKQLVAEAGSQKEAARRLGVKPGVFGKTLNEKRSGAEPSGTWYLHALARLGLPLDYFQVPGADEIDYREFLRARGAEPPVLTPLDVSQITEQLTELRDEIRRMREADATESRVRPKTKG